MDAALRVLVVLWLLSSIAVGIFCCHPTSFVIASFISFVLFFALGWILNILASGSIGGKMPVSRRALAKLGLTEIPDWARHTHVVMSDATKHPLLGDIIYIPYVRDIASIGDMFILFSLIVSTATNVFGVFFA